MQPLWHRFWFIAFLFQESPKAKFDFAPEGTPQLLCFKKNDVIRVEIKDEISEGMLYGKSSGKEGYFPAKRVADIEVRIDIDMDMSRHHTLSALNAWLFLVIGKK